MRKSVEIRALSLSSAFQTSRISFAEYPVALSVGRGPLDHVAGICVQPIALDGEVEHLSYQRQNAIGHDRSAGTTSSMRSRTSRRVISFTFVPPTGDQRHVGFFTGPLLVRRTPENPKVLAPAALLARVALDVFVGQLAKRFCAARLNIFCRQSLCRPVHPQRFARLFASIGQAHTRKRPDREPPQPAVYAIQRTTKEQ